MGFLRVQADWNNRPSSVQQPTSTPANYELRQRGRDIRRKRWTAKKGDVGKEKEGGGGTITKVDSGDKVRIGRTKEKDLKGREKRTRKMLS